jgi:hypothetical protein
LAFFLVFFLVAIRAVYHRLVGHSEHLGMTHLRTLAMIWTYYALGHLAPQKP